ncbi:MAG TPA: cellulase family glycosylhydrolase [Gemmatimonadaceae bacterium]|nr:cellulase family glycosylhydrolase [Gemmatimonadaceae bacterium]
MRSTTSHRPLGALFVALALAACGGDGATAPKKTEPGPTTGPAPVVHVSGARLVTASGTAIQLRGVDHSGTEYACIQGWGMFDGPHDGASVAAIAGWRANAVRVPLNESCWLGINGVKAEYAGANYQRAIVDYVSLLNHAGFVVIVELHWTGAGTTPETGQQPMPNRANTPEFWRQVATTFAGNDAVVFDLFNEPFPDGNRDTPEAWRCWRDGGTCAGMDYEAAGMQELVSAVRGTGATNVIMVGGIQYAGNLSGWLANRPTDPLQNLAASWHVYDFGGCVTTACWDAMAAPVARQVPLVLGEIGDATGGSAFVTTLMDWVDAHHGSYLAWTWNVWGSPLDLISSYDGTPTPYGATFRTRYRAS